MSLGSRQNLTFPARAQTRCAVSGVQERRQTYENTGPRSVAGRQRSLGGARLLPFATLLHACDTFVDGLSDSGRTGVRSQLVRGLHDGEYPGN